MLEICVPSGGFGRFSCMCILAMLEKVLVYIIFDVGSCFLHIFEMWREPLYLFRACYVIICVLVIFRNTEYIWVCEGKVYNYFMGLVVCHICAGDWWCEVYMNLYSERWLGYFIVNIWECEIMYS